MYSNLVNAGGTSSVVFCNPEKNRILILYCKRRPHARFLSKVTLTFLNLQIVDYYSKIQCHINLFSQNIYQKGFCKKF